MTALPRGARAHARGAGRALVAVPAQVLTSSGALAHAAAARPHAPPRAPARQLHAQVHCGANVRYTLVSAGGAHRGAGGMAGWRGTDANATSSLHRRCHCRCSAGRRHTPPLHCAPLRPCSTKGARRSMMGGRWSHAAPGARTDKPPLLQAGR